MEEKSIEVEGVFIISASTKDVFFNRLRRLEDLTPWSTGGFDSYEEDDEGGCWKVLTMGVFTTIDEVKQAINTMRKFKWFFDLDCGLLISGREIYSGGKWIKKNIPAKANNSK